METPEQTSELFTAGGTLPPTAPSYVKRPADDELFRHVIAGRFCYVLTARQMGKSSLMIRAAERLRKVGTRTAIVDLSKLGAHVSAEQWYLGVITQLARDLRLSVNTEHWWYEHRAFGPVQRFTDFLHGIALTEISGRIVIFIDEIDTTLTFDFRDDFFAAIRAMYNLRATNSEYNRLTFVLLGVATPTDLIQDRKRTPFNIGQAIDLQELSRNDAQPLEDGLEQIYPERGKAILDQVFYWTSGHPYLTQKLCLKITETPDGDWPDERINALVEQLFLATDAARKEDNLLFVRSRIEEDIDSLALLQLYRRAYQENIVGVDDRSPIQNRLRLSGLVRPHRSALVVHNEIYRQVFDDKWIRANTPVSMRWPIVVAAGILFMLIVAGAASRIINQPVASSLEATQTIAAIAVQTTNTAISIAAIATEASSRQTAIAEIPTSTLIAIDTTLTPIATSTPLVAPTITPIPEPFCQTISAVSLRAGPGINYPILGALSPRTRFIPRARDTNGFWIEVELPTGQVGWVFGAVALINCNNIDVNSLPIGNNIPPP